MFTFMDKAVVAAGVAFLGQILATYWGIEIDSTVQAAVVALIVGLATYQTPNKVS